MSLELLTNALNQEISYCDAEIAKKRKEIQSYMDVRNRLELLQRKLNHNILVPLGSVGFMPGRLINTNKVLVLLGDNYFVERSCFQACEIIDRRIAYMNGIIFKLESQKKLTTSKLEMSNDIFATNNDTIEIREPFLEVEPTKSVSYGSKCHTAIQPGVSISRKSFESSNTKETSVNGRSADEQSVGNEQNTQESSSSRSKIKGKFDEASQKGLNSNNSDEDFIRLMAHLDELAKQEELSNEDDGSDSSLDSDDLSASELELPEMSQATTIRQQTSDAKIIKENLFGPKKLRSVRFKPEIESYSLIGDTEERSVQPSAEENDKKIGSEKSQSTKATPHPILRNNSERSPVNINLIAETEIRDRRQILPESKEAFTGNIVERPAPENAVFHKANGEKSTSSQRVSLFKMMRQGNSTRDCSTFN